MSLSGLAVGVCIFFVTLFFQAAAGTWLVGTPASAITMLRVALVFIGIAAIFIGVLQK